MLFFFNYNFKTTKWNCSTGQTSALTTNTGLAAGSSELGGVTRMLVLKGRNGKENLFPAPSRCAGLWSAFQPDPSTSSMKTSNAQPASEV